MLQFILGRAASGKTTAVISMLRELTAPGREAVLIVPEQFSFDTERDILEALGDKTASLVKVMSFTRLCDEIERNTGGGAGAVLSDAHKLILLNRALKICEPELKIEVTVYTDAVDKTIEAVKKVHPYEEPVINVIPLWRTSF